MLLDDFTKYAVIACYDDKDFLNEYIRLTKSDFNIGRDKLLSMLNNEHEQVYAEFNNFVAFVIRYVVSRVEKY